MKENGHRLPTIAIVTDFGSRDPYAGIMKGVISRIAPSTAIIDLTNDIPPGDVRAAAFALWQAAPFMPPGTIFLAVVDPGVGSGRRAVAVPFSGFTFVGPDNGLITFLRLRDAGGPAVEISSATHRLPEAGSTFHGRDVFAPAAAHLAAGLPVAALGEEIEDLVMLPFPRLETTGDGGIRGEVIRADGFGNLLTSIGFLRPRKDSVLYRPWLTPEAGDISLAPLESLRVKLAGGEEIPLQKTFAEAPTGSPLAYIGSDGLLEIGVNRGNAAVHFAVYDGEEIVLS